MKKCYSCGATKNLKQMIHLDDDEYEDFSNGSTCKNCYLELGCPNEHGTIGDCIKDNFCDEAQKYRYRLLNWDNLDYHYKPKKGVKSFEPNLTIQNNGNAEGKQ